MCVQIECREDHLLALIRKAQSMKVIVVYSYKTEFLRKGHYVIDRVQFGRPVTAWSGIQGEKKSREVAFTIPYPALVALERLRAIITYC